MDGQDQRKPHFVVVPLLAQGHMIPMTDLALLLAGRGARVSLITTPVNAVRLRPAADYAAASGLSLRLVELPLPCAAVGLPDGCENVDLVPKNDLFLPFFRSLNLLADPLKTYLRAQPPAPTCIISDQCMPWTMEVAGELGIRRLVFHGPSCFYLLCTLNLTKHNLYEKVADDLESFVVPELPRRIEVSKMTAQRFCDWPGTNDVFWHMQKAEETADGVVLNTFYELERWWVDEYRRKLGKEVWPVGPVSLFYKDAGGKAIRGNNSMDGGRGVLTWLEGRERGSVLYVSFGSIARTRIEQLVEIARGLEAADTCFVWAVKEAEQSEEVDTWLSEFEERSGDRGLIIRGWAPQVLILADPAVGGFMTHCGWNSTLEAMTAGVPMVTWPHFGDQFLNSKLVVEVLGIGVGVGVKSPSFYQLEVGPATVGMDEVERAVVSVMGGGEEVEEMRRRAEEIGKKARMAMEKGGSSYESLTRLIHDGMALPWPAQ